MKTIVAALAAIVLTSSVSAFADGLIENDPSLRVSGFLDVDTSAPAPVGFDSGNRSEQQQEGDTRLFASGVVLAQSGNDAPNYALRDPSGGWPGFQQ